MPWFIYFCFCFVFVILLQPYNFSFPSFSLPRWFTHAQALKKCTHIVACATLFASKCNLLQSEWKQCPKEERILRKIYAEESCQCMLQRAWRESEGDIWQMQLEHFKSATAIASNNICFVMNCISSGVWEGCGARWQMLEGVAWMSKYINASYLIESDMYENAFICCWYCCFLLFVYLSLVQHCSVNN